jgi:hypothetical protein
MRKFTVLLSSLCLFLTACDREITCRALTNNDFKDFFGNFEAYPENLRFYSLNGDTNTYTVQVAYSDAYTCTSTPAKDCECDVSKRLSNSEANVADRFSIQINTEQTYNAVGSTGTARLTVGYNYSSFFIYGAAENLEERIISKQRSNEQPLRFVRDTLIENRLYPMVLVEPLSTEEGSFVLDHDQGIVSYTDTAGVSWYRIF